MISGHALSAERSKVSKSKAHAEAGPLELIERHSADALRYWATATRLGNDATFSPDTIATGRRLMTKLWNASRFAQQHLQDMQRQDLATPPAHLLPTDRWLLSRLARTVRYVTAELERYEYATARAEVERFFWSDLCDNYLELVKARLYSAHGDERGAAQWTLYHALLIVLKLLAPYLPFITEEIYQGLFRAWEDASSIHNSAWPAEHPEWIDYTAEETGQALLEILRHVRRYKAEHDLSVGAPLDTLRISTRPGSRMVLELILTDIRSATRAQHIVLEESGDDSAQIGVVQILADALPAD
jgi:valyl-tRNA synthetase